MQSESEEKIRPLASLGYRDFRYLFVGLAFLQVCSGLRNIANAFQVYQLTGDPRLLGLTFLFQGLPVLVMGLFGGSLADLVNRRILSQAVAVIQVALVLLLAGLTISGDIAVWHIYAVTLAASFLDSVSGPAQQAMIPAYVPPRHVMNATALRSTAHQVALLIGPLAGGFVVEVYGAGMAYLLNAALFVPAIVALALLSSPSRTATIRPKFTLPFLFEGFLVVVRTPALLAFILLDTVTMVFGYYPAMMPVMAKDVLQVGAAGLGALVAAPAAGALLGFVGVLMLGNVRRKGAVIIAVSIAHAVVLLLFAYSPWFVVSLFLAALLGFLDSMSVTVRMATFQLVARDEQRGRVMSVLFVSATGANSLGGAYLGFVTSLLGPREALATGALVAGAFALLVLFLRKDVRRFRTDE